MKFGRTLRENILKEWRFYSVDYKALKKSLKSSGSNKAVNSEDISEHEESDNLEEVYNQKFHSTLESSKDNLSRFYHDKEKWAFTYIETLEERLQKLRETASQQTSPRSEELDFNPASSSISSSISGSASSSNSVTSDRSEDNLDHSSDEEGDDVASSDSPKGTMDLSIRPKARGKYSDNSKLVNSAWLKDEYKRIGQSEHFHNFIYAKKSLSTFERELDLLLEFLELNKIAFSKILKKYDKRLGTSIKESTLAEIRKSLPFLDGSALLQLKNKVSDMIKETNSLRPNLPEGWDQRKVYTIGCFDLFHRGHQNVLSSLREFGYYVVAGIHDDQSYFDLKNKYPIDNLATRMENTKPFVDQIFVIPSTDPLLYIKNMVSAQDIETGSCCYARGDDMLQFPGREWVETVMPVHFVPRTESCSSSLIRTIYHGGNDELSKKAAFAKTRYDGKPVDDEGNVLKVSVTSEAK